MKQTFNKIGFAWGSTHGLLSGVEGRVYGIGNNSMGQLGIGSFTSVSEPTLIDLNDVIMYDCAPDISAFITLDGSLYVTGYTDWVNGTLQYYNTPQKIAEECVALTLAKSTLFIITNRGTVKGVGCNTQYQMGRNNTTNTTSLVSIDRVSEIKGIAATDDHTFFLKTNGTVYCCGPNPIGALGTGTNGETYKIPTLVSINQVKSIDTNIQHTIFLKEDGTVYACGYNGDGRLGCGVTTNKSTPTICDISDVTEVDAGFDHSLFLKADGTVYACGGNRYGQLCTGDNNNYLSPTKCAIEDVLGIYADDYFSAFLKEDGLYLSGLLPM